MGQVSRDEMQSIIVKRFNKRFVETGKPAVQTQYSPQEGAVTTTVSFGDAFVTCEKRGTYDTAWRREQRQNSPYPHYYSRFCDRGTAYWIRWVSPSYPDISIHEDGDTKGGRRLTYLDEPYTWRGPKPRLGDAFLTRALDVMRK